MNTDTPRGSVYLLWHGLTHSHSCFEADQFQHGLFHASQCQRCVYSSMALPMAAAPPGLHLLSPGLIHSHTLWGTLPWPQAQPLMFQVCLLQHGLTIGPQSLRRSSTDVTTGTDTVRCTCSGMALSRATDASGCPAPTWTHSQIRGPSTRVHTRDAACPEEQHNSSSSGHLPARHIATAVIERFPGTAE